MSAHEWFQLSCQQTINYPGCPFCNSWSGQSGKFIPVVFLTTGTDFSTTTTVDVDRRNLAALRDVVVRSRCRALGFKIDDFRISTQLEIAAQMIFAPLCVRLQGLTDDERNFWPNCTGRWFKNFTRKERFFNVSNLNNTFLTLKKLC